LVFPFVVKAIEPLKWSRAQYGFVIALAAISTKSWLVIKGQFHDNAFMYPDQLYTMHWGPFMGTDMYLVHLGAVAVAALALYLVCFQRGRRRPASEKHAASRVRMAAIRQQRPRSAAQWDEKAGTIAS
jgi:hypothetical protein